MLCRKQQGLAFYRQPLPEVELTDKMRQYFPEDPVRADFALFGLGVDKA